MFAVLLSHVTRSKNLADEARARARHRLQQRESEFSPLDAEIPPLSEPGLKWMESRCPMASPSQLRRWIREIEDQYDRMTPGDQEYAWALMLKLSVRVEAFECWTDRTFPTAHP